MVWGAIAAAALGVGYNIVSDVLKERRRKKEEENAELTQYQYHIGSVDKEARSAYENATMLTAGSGMREQTLIPSMQLAVEKARSGLSAQYPKGSALYNKNKLPYAQIGSSGRRTLSEISASGGRTSNPFKPKFF